MKGTFCGLLLGFCLTASAQDVGLVAAMDRNPVGLGEQFTLSFTLTNAGMGGGKNLQLPDLGKFHVMSGPNQSTSMQIINGAVSSSVTTSYVLQPKEMGKFTIGAATIDAAGTTIRSQPLTVEVVQGQPQRQQPVAPAEELVSQIGDNLFVKAVVDRTRVLQGEQINVTFKVYTRINVMNIAIDKTPALVGFWSEDLDSPKDEGLGTEVVNGKQYRVRVIKRMALFPTQSGTLEVSPMVLQTAIQVRSPRSSDPFESFFRDPFGRTVNHTIRSEPVKISVEPLPGGSPEDFRGAVGQYAMSATLDPRTTRANEPVTLKVTISGTGNIKLLEAPTIVFPPDFEQYAPKVSESIGRSQARISGSKSFEYLLIPRYPGLKTVKPVTFSFFDPVRREYQRLRSPKLEVNVEPGAAVAGPGIPGAAREDVRLLSQDIRFIKVTTPALSVVGEALHTSGIFAVLALLPLAGVATAFVFARRRSAELQDEAGARTRRAMRVARAGLRKAEYLLREKSGSSGQPSSLQRLRFYGEVARALWKYLGDKLAILPSALSVETATASLKERGVDHGLIHALKTLLESCELARFAPTSHELSAMQRSYTEARRIIVELERTLK